MVDPVWQMLRPYIDLHAGDPGKIKRRDVNPALHSWGASRKGEATAMWDLNTHGPNWQMLHPYMDQILA